MVCARARAAVTRCSASVRTRAVRSAPKRRARSSACAACRPRARKNSRSSGGKARGAVKVKDIAPTASPPTVRGTVASAWVPSASNTCGISGKVAPRAARSSRKNAWPVRTLVAVGTGALAGNRAYAAESAGGNPVWRRVTNSGAASPNACGARTVSMPVAAPAAATPCATTTSATSSGVVVAARAAVSAWRRSARSRARSTSRRARTCAVMSLPCAITPTRTGAAAALGSSSGR